MHCISHIKQFSLEKSQFLRINFHWVIKVYSENEKKSNSILKDRIANQKRSVTIAWKNSAVHLDHMSKQKM